MANPTLISTLKNFQFNDALNDFLSFSCPSMESAYNAAVFSGLLAITTHLLISQICKLFGNKIIAKDSGFAAHQFVAMYNMLLLFFVGGTEWIQSTKPGTANERIFDPNSTARWLGAITLGQLLMWDIPCGFGLVTSMKGDMIMLAHHVIMAYVGYIGMFHLTSYYYLFFFGFCELSSIPLAIVDFFHPKHFEALTKSSAILSKINEISRILFAVLFILMRAMYFPYVYATMLVPDIMELLQKQPYVVNKSKANMLWMILGASTSLTCLQLYWAKLVLNQVIKLLNGGGNGDNKKKKR